MRTVAIIGASADRRKFGNKSVRAHVQAGWNVFPVNPTASRIEGLSVYKSVLDIPIQVIDRISVYLPPAVAIEVLDELAQVRPTEFWLNPGADDPQVVAMAESLGLKVVRGCSIIDVGFSPSNFPDA
jgi:predicted CoA-binding protein